MMTNRTDSFLHLRIDGAPLINKETRHLLEYTSGSGVSIRSPGLPQSFFICFCIVQSFLFEGKEAYWVTGMEREWMDLGAINMAIRGKKKSPDGYGIPTPASTGFRAKGNIYLGTHTARNGLF